VLEDRIDEGHQIASGLRRATCSEQARDDSLNVCWRYRFQRKRSDTRFEMHSLHRLQVLEIRLPDTLQGLRSPQRFGRTAQGQRGSVSPPRRIELLGVLQLPKRPLGLSASQPVSASGRTNPPNTSVQLSSVGRAPAAVIGTGCFVQLTGPVAALRRHRFRIYVAASLARVRERASAGQPIAIVGHTGDAASLGHGHIEIGFSKSSGDPLSHHGATASTPSGIAMRRVLVELSAAFGIKNS
jgi:hypothetical protein